MPSGSGWPGDIAEEDGESDDVAVCGEGEESVGTGAVDADDGDDAADGTGAGGGADGADTADASDGV